MSVVVHNGKAPKSVQENLNDLINVPQVVNSAYLEFIQGLYTAIGQEVSGLRGELQFVMDSFQRYGMSTDVVYKRLIPGLLNVAKSLYAKDPSLFSQHVRTTTPQVGFFECACIYDVFPKFDFDEKLALWESLQNLTQTIGILASKSQHVSAFTNLARNFLASNPNLPPSEHRSQFMKQMLTNEGMKKEALRLLDGNLKALADDVVNIVRSQGLEGGDDETPEEERKTRVEELFEVKSDLPVIDVMNPPTQDEVSALYESRDAMRVKESEMTSAEYYAYLANQQEEDAAVNIHTAAGDSQSKKKTKKANISDLIRYVQSSDLSEQGQQDISAVAHAALDQHQETDMTEDQLAQKVAVSTFFNSFLDDPTKAKDELFDQLPPDKRAEFDHLFAAMSSGK